MELASIQDVNNEFFNLFLSEAVDKPFAGEDCPFIEVPKGSGTIDVLVRYYNRGGSSGRTELPEKYPVLVIQDFTPEFAADRMMVKDWLDASVNHTDKTVQTITLPVPLNFQYQVSLFSTVKTDNDALMTYMYRKFGVGSVNRCFLFKRQVVPVSLEVIGLPVPYRVSVTTVEREDGRFEWAVTYTLMTYVHLTAPTWAPYIEQIEMVLNNLDTAGNKAVTEFLVKGKGV
jgi:hypothetical protein